MQIHNSFYSISITLQFHFIFGESRRFHWIAFIYVYFRLTFLHKCLHFILFLILFSFKIGPIIFFKPFTNCEPKLHNSLYTMKQMLGKLKF